MYSEETQRLVQNEEDFFPWIKQITEKFWETARIKPNISGFQIQPQTKWNPGLAESEILNFESEMGFPFPSILRNYYLTMNGLSQPGINVFASQRIEPSFCSLFYSYPNDLNTIRELISWIYEEFNLTPMKVASNGISRIFPIYSHRFLLLDHHPNLILSMYGNDVIPYHKSLQYLFLNEVLFLDYPNSDIAEEDVSTVRFWLD